MKRENFVKIIKLRSFWKIDKRIGDYVLPNGDKLSRYVHSLVTSQMEIDGLGIRKNGDLCFCTGGKWNDDTKDFDNFELMPPFEDNETCGFEVMERRVNGLVREIVG